MKYGIFIVRKYSCIVKNEKEIVRSLYGNDQLLNYLCSLLGYPDNTVRVNNLINFSMKYLGYLLTSLIINTKLLISSQLDMKI